MRKHLGILLLLSAYLQVTAQIKECPKSNQKHYRCENVVETILDQTVPRGYQMNCHFNVRLKNSFDNKSDTDKANQVVALCNQVLNDRDFWYAVENYRNYKYTVFEDKDGKHQVSGMQIVNCLINGTPNDSSRPTELDVSLTVQLYGLPFATFFESALAKEVGDGIIYNKRWFFKNYSVSDIGSNWIHEFSHSKGLTHCYYCNEDRDFSVPYVINRIFDEVARKYIAPNSREVGDE